MSIFEATNLQLPESENMNVIQKIARGLIFPVITTLGLEKLFSAMTSNNYLIIMYHGVVEDQADRINGRHIGRSTFIRHLEYFKSNFEVLPLEQVFTNYRNGIKPNRKSIALTFDDGYLNNYTLVAPLLKEYNMPATFFIQGMSMVDPESVTWPDVIDVLFHFKEKYLNLGDVVYEADFSKRGYYNPESGLPIMNTIKRLDPEERDQFLSNLEINFKYTDLLRRIDKNLWKLMSVSEVQSLAHDSLFEIGSHSYSHFNLTSINESYIKDELKKTKEILEEICQKDVVSLAFPDGSYDAKVKKISLETGYRNLCAVDYRLQEDANDLSILQRYGFSATTTASSNIVFMRNSFRSHGC